MVEGGSEGLVDMLDRVEKTPGSDEASIGEIVESFGRRSFGSLLVIVSLLAILPRRAIPGAGSLTGALLLMFCLQMPFGARNVWIPGWLGRQTLTRERLENSVERVRTGRDRSSPPSEARVSLKGSGP